MIDIDTKDLKIGMYVEHLDRPWLETPFLFHGFLIENQHQIEQLQLIAKAVKIDEAKSQQAPKPTQAKPHVVTEQAIPPAAQSNKQRFADEMAMANAAYDETLIALNKVLANFRLNNNITLAEIQSCVQGVVKSILHSPNTLLLVGSMRPKRQDTLSHSINSCIFGTLFGRYLGFHEEQLIRLSVAALFHDVGETKIPESILDKHNLGLTPDEKTLVERHTELGAEMLRKIPEIPAEIVEVAHSHHERVDGKGYPRGLADAEISLMSRIITIIDAYEQVTNSSNPQNQLSNADALKNLYAMSDTCFDTELVEGFMKCLGPYPVGTLIQLNNGAKGVVIGIKPEKHLLPIVMIIREADGKIRPPRIINLDRLRDQNNNPLLIINKIIQPDELGIGLSDYMAREFGNNLK